MIENQNTSRLNLPMLMPAQALKYVTLNTALEALDTLVQLTIKDVVKTPPQFPTAGDIFRIGVEAEGLFAGKSGLLATYANETWRFVQPREGWQAFNLQSETSDIFLHGDWINQSVPSKISVDHIGVGSEVDPSLALTAFGDASLFNGGAGHQLKLNRPTDADTASLVFSTDFQGAVEIGLTGSDGFTVKASQDGQDFETALEIETNGVVNALQGLNRDGYKVWDAGNAPGLLFDRGIISNGTDLDTLIQQGIYTQTSNYGASTGQNYPRVLAGTLTVRETYFGIQQDYRLYGGAPNDEGDAVFIRSFYGGSWRAWRKLQSIPA